GLDTRRFTPANLRWTPPAAFDALRSWEGTFPERPDMPIHVDAAWWRGKPVYFDVQAPGAAAERDFRGDPWTRNGLPLWITLDVVLLACGSILAWRNLRLARGDRQGAIRLASIAFAMSLGAWACTAHLLPSTWMGKLLILAVAQALWTGFELWLAWIALEPAVRRRWPHILISWTRLLNGKWRDPLVGRDVLVGVLVGLAYNGIIDLLLTIDLRHHGIPGTMTDLSSLSGFAHVTSGVLTHVIRGMRGGFTMFFLYFLVRMVVRKDWLALPIFVVAFALRGYDNGLVATAMFAVIYGGLMLMLLRYGLLSLVAAIFITDLPLAFCYTTHFTAWYGTSTVVVTLLMIALVIYAFRTAIGPRRLLGALLEQ